MTCLVIEKIEYFSNVSLCITKLSHVGLSNVLLIIQNSILGIMMYLSN